MAEEGVDDGRPARDERRFAQVTQDTQDGVELLELSLLSNPTEENQCSNAVFCLARSVRLTRETPLSGPAPASSPERDSLAHLGDDDEVKYDGRGEQRVFARVVQHDGRAPAQHDLRRVLVHGALAVAHVRHVLDHDLQERETWKSRHSST